MVRPEPTLPGLAVVALAVAFAWGWAWATSSFERVAVVGDSMSPGLLAGDRLVVHRLPLRWRGRVLKPGDIVVATDPRQPSRVLVKRVAKAEGQEIWLAGDNPGRSTDSRDFGPVPLSGVVGKVVYRYAPPARAGRVGRGARGAPGGPGGRARSGT